LYNAIKQQKLKYTLICALLPPNNNKKPTVSKYCSVPASDRLCIVLFKEYFHDEPSINYNRSNKEATLKYTWKLK
jgi:hypothetical protein